MLTLEWLHKMCLLLPGKRIFNFTVLPVFHFPVPTFHHFAHNLVISFETPLRPQYARSVKCQMHVKGNMSEPFPTLFFRHFILFFF